MSPEPVMPPWITPDLIPFTDEQVDITSPDPDDETLERIWEWVPANDDEAEVAMARLGRARVLLEDAEAKKRQHEATIRAWYEAETKPLQRRVLRYTEALQAFAREYRRTTHRATMNLPSGVVVTQDREPSVLLPNSDENYEALVAWLKGQKPEVLAKVLKVEETVQISELRKVVKIENGRVFGPDGDEVPGVLVDPGGIVAQTPKPGAVS